MAADMANLQKRYLMGELFAADMASPRGLTSAHAAALLRVCGANVLETRNKRSKILAYLPLAVEIAAVLAMAVGLATGGGHVAFGYAVLALLAADFAVGYEERNSAGESVASALVAGLEPSRRAFWVLRDGVWSVQDAAALVLGDIIHIRSGDVVPADAWLLEKATESSQPETIKIDESALTGEGDTLLSAKGYGDAVYAGSVCAKGEAPAVVAASGGRIYLAKADRLADAVHTRGAVLEAARAAWNACVVWACFAVLADAGHVSSYVVGLLLGAVLLAGTGFMLSDYWMVLCDSWANGGRDPEELMLARRRVRRCRDRDMLLLVSDELAAMLVSHYEWTLP